MATLCSCATGGGNTGQPACFPTIDVTQQVILVNYFKTDGTVNGITLSTLTGGIIDQTFLDGKFKSADTNTRWYPTPLLENITDERDEDVTETFNSTNEVFIREGARKFEGFVIKSSPILVGNLKSWRCSTIGVYYIDDAGNLVGVKSADGLSLNPVRLQDESFSVGMIKNTDTTISKTSIKFTVSKLEDDADLAMIEGAYVTGELEGSKGLVDVVSEAATTISTTGFTAQMNTNFGGCTSTIVASGLVVADFEVYNVTNSAAVVITSVTESAVTSGLYVFVLPSQTSADVLTVQGVTTGTIPKYVNITASTVTIP